VIFPDGFLWGASTSAHQTEGNNLASDLWALENLPGSPFPERSGDACDSWHRWEEDLDLARGLGLGAYRFSVEWARVEPVRGQVSQAAVSHYRRMVEGCHRRGLVPVVTLHHFALPLWFHKHGSWLAADSAALFGAYVESVLPVLDGVPWVCTINEPNVLAMVDAARHDPTGAPALPRQELVAALVAGHRAAREVVAAVPGCRSGWTVASQDVQALPGGEERAAEVRARVEDDFLRAAAGDDFVGLQAYTRMLVGPQGKVTPQGPGLTLTGWEVYPQALGDAVRHATALLPGTPLLVTESGIATADCDQRIAYTAAALAGLHQAMEEGADVRGYLHWSLLDNYEWGSWTPTFGLVAVDRRDFTRTVKRSGLWYGGVAAAGRVPVLPEA
jgi:beta-glucosidase